MFGQALRLISAVVVGTIISLSASAQRYSIKLDLQERRGLTYHLVASSTQTTTAEATSNGQTVTKAEDKMTVEMVANVTVLEAANGWAARKRFTILSSRVISGDRTYPILPNRTEVVASIKNGQTVYEANGKLVDEQTAGVFRTVISFHVVSVGDDDLFGTRMPRRVGERWSINENAVKQLLKDVGAQGGRQQITGTGILEKVEDNHTFVRISMNVKDVLLPIRPELTTEAGGIQNELWGRFPLRPGDVTEEFNGTIRLSRLGSGVDATGKKILVYVVYEKLDRFELSPVEK